MCANRPIATAAARAQQSADEIATAALHPGHKSGEDISRRRYAVKIERTPPRISEMLSTRGSCRYYVFSLYSLGDKRHYALADSPIYFRNKADARHHAARLRNAIRAAGFVCN